MRRAFGSMVILGLVAAGAVACGSGGSDQVSTDGTELARLAFVSPPSQADQQRTVDALNERFASAEVDAHAALDGGAVVVTADRGSSTSRSNIEGLIERGTLLFRPVLDEFGPDSDTVPDPDGIATQVEDLPELDPNGRVIEVYRVGASTLDGTALQGASAGRDQRGAWEVRPTFREGADGIDAFNAAVATCFDFAPACPTSQLAIVLDGRLIIAPRVISRSFARDEISIGGQLDEQRAKDIAAVLSSGPLPADLQPGD